MLLPLVLTLGMKGYRSDVVVKNSVWCWMWGWCVLTAQAQPLAPPPQQGPRTQAAHERHAQRVQLREAVRAQYAPAPQAVPHGEPEREPELLAPPPRRHLSAAERHMLREQLRQMRPPP